MASLTSKELSALNDQMEAEKLMIKKYTMYAQNTSDQEIKAQLESIATKHCAHFDKLYSLLG